MAKPILVFILAVGCSSETDSAVDSGVDEVALCDDSPVKLPDGTSMSYGCRYLHHWMKARLNGTEITEDLEVCGAKGCCLHQLRFVCERWFFIESEISIIVDGTTGLIETHSMSHGGRIALPEKLELPIYTRPGGQQPLAPCKGRTLDNVRDPESVHGPFPLPVLPDQTVLP